MKTYLIGAATAIGLLILGYIQYLRSKLNSRKAENVSLKTQVEQSEWQSLIDQAGVKVRESEKDYREAADDFRNRHPNPPDGDSKG
jgi:hypothetical protein